MGLYRAFSQGCQLALGYPLVKGLHRFLDDESLGVAGLVSLVAADLMTSWADTTAFMYGGWYCCLFCFYGCGMVVVIMAYLPVVVVVMMMSVSMWVFYPRNITMTT